MKKAGVRGIMSSIHSVSPEKTRFLHGHRQLRGRKALDSLRECRKKGFLTGFNSVLTDEQIISGGIDELMALAELNDCDYVQLIHPKACGRASMTVFDAEAHEKAVKTACEAQIRYNSSRVKHAPVLTAQVYEESESMLGCTCGGTDRFYIGCSGEVQPCEFVNVSFGSLADESFETVYSRMREAFPVPSCSWVCCERAHEIAEAVKAAGGATPLPQELTQTL